MSNNNSLCFVFLYKRSFLRYYTLYLSKKFTLKGKCDIFGLKVQKYIIFHINM